MQEKSTLRKRNRKVASAIAASAFCLLGMGPLNAQITYSFTTAGATGMNGPSQMQVNTAYQLTNLNGSVICNGGIQSFTIPANSNYSIVVAGAGGGASSNNGGRGKIISAVKSLTGGTVLRILVGQKGGVTGSSGGGGGSFVVDANNNPIVIAGGGAGFLDNSIASPQPLSDATFANNGQNSSDGTGQGGVNGQGGTGTNQGWGGGGGGFNTDGTDAANCWTTKGISFLNGGMGGNTCNNTTGGFGGGAGTHGNTGGGGGGGGYSGGGGSSQDMFNATGGGGGSFIDPLAQNPQDIGFNLNAGYVIITKLYSVDITQSGTISCFGQTNVTLTAQGSGGVAPYTYTWAPGGATTTVLNNVGAGVYTCTITDQNGEQATSTYTVTQPSQLNGTINNINNVACKGGIDGSAHIAASGGVGPYQYAWVPNGGYVSTAFGLAAGTYTAYVLDQNACQISRTVTITQPLTSIGVNATNLSICPAGSVVLTGTGSTTYTWTGGITNGILFTPTITSTYTVTGTNTLTGCTHSMAVTVTVNPQPVLDVAGSTSVCPGQIITLGASGAATYTWQPGNLTGIFVNVSPTVNTTYTVTGKSAQGCFSSGIYTLAVAMTTCVGIDENTNTLTNLSVYPNPTNGEFVVELNNGLTKTIELFDVTGRIVLSGTGSADKLNFNMSELANGVYYLKVQSNQSSKITKLVKH